MALAVLAFGAIGAGAQTAGLLRPSQTDDALLDPPVEPETAVPAQIIPEALPVKRKRRKLADPFAAQGLAVGALRLYPAMEFDAVTSTDTTAGLRIKPSAQLKSDWSRHALDAGLTGDLTFDSAGGSISDLSLGANARLRLDIHHDLTTTLETRYGLDRSPASDSEVPDAAASARVDQNYSASGNLVRQAGRLSLQGKTGVAVFRFGDVDLNGGGTEDNSDRDYVEPEISARAAYESSALLKPFGEAAYRPRLHFNAQDRNGLDRDSDGYILSAGVALNDEPFWTGELALNYIWRDYADPALDTISALGVSGALTWRPTELTEAVLTASTGISETASAASSGTPDYSLAAIVSHAPREYLSLSAGIGLEFEDIAGAGGDLSITPRLGLIYRLTPEIAWTANAQLTLFDGAAAGSDRTDYLLSTGVELRR